jgi:cytoskeleton protein RodZ
VSIGQTLAEARASAGLTVEEVAAATRLRRTLVVGIERDDYSACGGDFYARGHVRNFAKAVGIDAQPLLDEFDASRPGAAPPRATDVFESVTGARPERRGPNWSAAMAAALVLVVVYGVTQVVSSGGDGTVTDGLPDGPRGTVSESATEPVPTPSASGDSSAVAQAPRDKVTVAVRARGASWVRVTTASGKELFQGLLEDRSRTFTDKTRIQLVVGNAGAVSLTVNGTPIGAPGKPGQVARVQFTPEDPAGG